MIGSVATVFACVMLAVLAIGALVWLGWVSSPALVYLVLGFALVAGFLSGLVAVIRALDRRLDRQWLGAAVEREQEPLLDRLNAVLELEHQPQSTSTAMYRHAIEAQATQVLNQAPDRGTFSWHATWLRVAFAAFTLLVTVWFYAQLHPLRLLTTQASEDHSQTDLGDGLLTIPELTEASLDAAAGIDPTQQESWVEVRISEPGRDLRVTRFEDVPLLIEAASDRPLTRVTWTTTVNLESESTHALPDLEDPRYAVFQPVLRPDELGLKDWDLVHYRAQAVAEDNSEHRSATYFIEIIPSRDVLEEIPEQGYRYLEEMTDLIEQQQEVIRQTDRLSSRKDLQQATQFDALAAQESRIARASQMQQLALEDLLRSPATDRLSETLDASREALQQAQAALQNHDPTAAANPEQEALLKLAEARRQFAELVRQHPEAFQTNALAEVEQARDRGITAADPEFAELLEEIHREAQEVAEVSSELEQLAAEQHAFLDGLQRRGLDPADRPLAAQSERDIQQRLQALRDAHPEPFRDLRTELDRANEDLTRAAEQIAAAPLPLARNATAKATEQLQQLADELERRELAYQVAQQETLQDRLEANRQTYREMQAQPDRFAAQQVADTTRDTQQLVEELQQLAAENSLSQQPDESAQAQPPNQPNDPPGSSDPSNGAESNGAESELAKQLAGDKADEILQQCDSLRQSDSNTQRSSLAGELGRSLDQLSTALEQDLRQQGSQLQQQQLASQLDQMQRRNQAIQNAREFVQQALTRQRMIQRDAFLDQAQKQRYPSLAENQANLQQSLANQMERNSEGFERVAKQGEAAQSGMQQAAQSLRSNSQDASQAADEAAQQLQQLDEALARQQNHQQIGDRQLVQDQLRQLSERLEDYARQPESVRPEQKQQTAGQCKSLGSKACQLASQSGSAGSSASSTGASSGSESSPSPSPSAATPADSSQASAGQPGAEPSSAKQPGAEQPGAEPSTAGQPGAAPGQPPSPSGAPSPGDRPAPGSRSPLAGAPSAQQGAGADPRQQQIEAASNRLADSRGSQETAAAARDLQRQLQQLARDLGSDPNSGQPGTKQQGTKQQGTEQQGMGQQGMGQQGMGQQAAGPTRPMPQAGLPSANRRAAGMSGQANAGNRSAGRDALRPAGIEAIQRGLAQLESAARRQQQGDLSPEAEQSLRRGGVADVTVGIRSNYGYNENSRAVIGRITEEFSEPGFPVDLKTLQQLREQIQSLQQDLTSHSQEDPKEVSTLIADPSEFPADYRDSIQKYYQNLSEER